MTYNIEKFNGFSDLEWKVKVECNLPVHLYKGTSLEEDFEQTTTNEFGVRALYFTQFNDGLKWYTSRCN